MPTISTFHGIDIQMFWNDHNPPHFHARHAGLVALFDIQTLELIRGDLSERAITMILEWAQKHREELLEDWTLCQTMQSPKPIEPLP